MSDEFAEIRDYDGLIAAVVARLTTIGLTHEGLEALGFAKGHIGKLLAPNRTKNIGPKTLGSILELTGMKLVAVEDRETTERMRPYWEKRIKAKPILTIVRTRPAVWLFTPRSSRRALKTRHDKLSAEERSKIGRKAIRVRWAKVRRRRKMLKKLRMSRDAAPNATAHALLPKPRSTN